MNLSIYQPTEPALNPSYAAESDPINQPINQSTEDSDDEIVEPPTNRRRTENYLQAEQDAEVDHHRSTTSRSLHPNRSLTLDYTSTSGGQLVCTDCEINLTEHAGSEHRDISDVLNHQNEEIQRLRISLNEILVQALERQSEQAEFNKRIDQLRSLLGTINEVKGASRSTVSNSTLEYQAEVIQAYLACGSGMNCVYDVDAIIGKLNQLDGLDTSSLPFDSVFSQRQVVLNQSTLFETKMGQLLDDGIDLSAKVDEVQSVIDQISEVLNGYLDQIGESSPSDFKLVDEDGALVADPVVHVRELMNSGEVLTDSKLLEASSRLDYFLRATERVPPADLDVIVSFAKRNMLLSPRSTSDVSASLIELMVLVSRHKRTHTIQQIVSKNQVTDLPYEAKGDENELE